MGKKRKTKLDPSKAVAYLRVSTEDQLLGADAQREAVERYASTRHLTVVAWETDQGVSGSTPAEERPGLTRALQGMTELSAGKLLIAKRDRLARDVVIAATVTRAVEKLGGAIESADGLNDTSAEGDLLRGMVDLMAQHERALIRRRTKDALSVKRRRGEKLGGSDPYGFRTVQENGVLVLKPREEEQIVIQEIKEYAEMGLSPGRIARELNERQVPARGVRWYPTTIARLLATLATDFPPSATSSN